MVEESLQKTALSDNKLSFSACGWLYPFTYQPMKCNAKRTKLMAVKLFPSLCLSAQSGNFPKNEPFKSIQGEKAKKKKRKEKEEKERKKSPICWSWRTVW